MKKRKNKVRTSITIDPDLLEEVRKDAQYGVSQYIETVLRAFREAQKAGEQADD